MVRLTPRHPISQVLDSTKHVLQGLGPKKLFIQGRPSQKWPFFAEKWLKNANFGPKTVFFGLGWSVGRPPDLFRRCSTQQNMYCRAGDVNNS